MADSIGVTFQQVQKYERGANRVSASTLMRIAQALTVDVSDLLPKTKSNRSSPNPIDGPNVADMAVMMGKLNPEGRRLLVDLARTLIANDAFKADR